MCALPGGQACCTRLVREDLALPTMFDHEPCDGQAPALPQPSQFDTVLQWLQGILRGEGGSNLWVCTGANSTGTGELRLLAWLWALLGSARVSLVQGLADAGVQSGMVTDTVCMLRCVTVADDVKGDAACACVHVASGLPVNPLPWDVAAFVDEKDVPSAPTSSQLPSILAHVNGLPPLPDACRPRSMEFWRGLPAGFAMQTFRQSHTDRCGDVLQATREACVTGPDLFMPLKSLHGALCAALGESSEGSVQAWARDPAVIEALRLLHCRVGASAENRVWPRGGGRRKHTVFVHGIDLKVVG